MLEREMLRTIYKWGVERNLMVGVAGFEPTISSPPDWRLIRARPHPDV
jgi:hypothetical protein